MKFSVTASGEGDKHWIKETAHLAIEEMSRGVSGGTIRHDEGNHFKWKLTVKETKNIKWRELK